MIAKVALKDFRYTFTHKSVLVILVKSSFFIALFFFSLAVDLFEMPAWYISLPVAWIVAFAVVHLWFHRIARPRML